MVSRVTDLYKAELGFWWGGILAGASELAANAFGVDNAQIPLPAGNPTIPLSAVLLGATALGIAPALILPEVRAWAGRYRVREYEYAPLPEVAHSPENYRGKAVQVEGLLRHRDDGLKKTGYRWLQEETFFLTSGSATIDVVRPVRLGYVPSGWREGPAQVSGVVEQDRRTKMPQLYALAIEPKKIAQRA